MALLTGRRSVKCVPYTASAAALVYIVVFLHKQVYALGSERHNFAARLAAFWLPKAKHLLIARPGISC